jgi:uncharacterized protein
MGIDKDEIVRLTQEYGGEWGINHTRRILYLVSLIGEGMEYDAEAVWLAAHLHDWGAYAKWAKPGTDHAARSAEVAEGFLKERGYPQERAALVLECIRSHHSGDPDRSLEAVLLSDADGLDFLGAAGVMRDFSKSPRDMRRGYDAAKGRMEKVPRLLCLAKSKELAGARLREMDELLKAFERSTFGYF